MIVFYKIGVNNSKNFAINKNLFVNYSNS